jgi:hypothetical protein
MSELFCIGCHQKKHGPTPGICFDCWNAVIQKQKMLNRKKLEKKDG